MKRITRSVQEIFYKVKLGLLVALLLFLHTSCQWLGETYIGLNIQPKVNKSDFDPGLNLFGALKTGVTFDTINHYFEVQQLLSLVDTTRNMLIDSAEIALQRHMLSGEVKSYSLKNYGEGHYFNNGLEIRAGEKWDCTCSYKSFIVNSSCTIPNEPVIKQGSLKVDNRNLQFEVIKDSTAFIYDIYVLSDSNYYFDRVVAQQHANTVFSFQLEWEILSGHTKLYVFAYDKQFETYFSTSSIFFKPNAFWLPYSTVTGGYGVFGAISSTFVVLK